MMIIFWFSSESWSLPAPGVTTEGRTRMQRAEVKARHAEGKIFATHVMQNPTNTREWIVFFKQDAGQSYFLVDEKEEVESFANLDEAVEELRLLGLKQAEVHF
jgi:hypothetical protein